MQGDLGARNKPRYVTPPSKELLGVLEGAPIRMDREVYGLISGMSGWRSRIVFQLKEKEYGMSVYVGCASVEVDDQLMGSPGKGHYDSVERLRQRIKIGKWHWLLQDGPSFFGGRHSAQLPDRSFKVDMMRGTREELQPISLQRRRCRNKDAEATESEVKARSRRKGALRRKQRFGQVETNRGCGTLHPHVSVR